MAEHELPPVAAPSVVATWDAGDLACGELVLELRQRMAQLNAGDALCLLTRDLGAILDIPAWCRVTGHRLMVASHPAYYIERRP